jgi:hypothetical protein
MSGLIEHRAPESIEHRACGECDAPIAADSYICPRDPHHHVLKVEYVQREAARGAVDAFDRIVVACDNGSEPENKLTFIRRVADDARAALRGQS